MSPRRCLFKLLACGFGESFHAGAPRRGVSEHLMIFDGRSERQLGFSQEAESPTLNSHEILQFANLRRQTSGGFMLGGV